MIDPATYTIGNVALVLANRVVDQGWLSVADGMIAALGEGQPSCPVRGDAVIDGAGDAHRSRTG